MSAVFCVLGGVVVSAYVTQKLAVEAWGWSYGAVLAMFVGVATLIASIAYVLVQREA